MTVVNKPIIANYTFLSLTQLQKHTKFCKNPPNGYILENKIINNEIASEDFFHKLINQRYFLYIVRLSSINKDKKMLLYSLLRRLIYKLLHFDILILILWRHLQERNQCVYRAVSKKSFEIF